MRIDVPWRVATLLLLASLASCSPDTVTIRGTFQFSLLEQAPEGSAVDASCLEVDTQDWIVSVYREDSGDIIASDDPVVTADEGVRFGLVEPGSSSDVLCEVTGSFALTEVPEAPFYTLVGPGHCDLANYSEAVVTLAEARNPNFRVTLQCPTR